MRIVYNLLNIIGLVAVLCVVSAFQPVDTGKSAAQNEKKEANANVARLAGAWRVDIPQGDGVVIPTYFVLHPNGDNYEGTVSIKATVDLPIRNPHWEEGDFVFGTDWNIGYRLHPEGESFFVTINYGNGFEKGSAIRIPETEAMTPKALPLPELTDVPSNGAAATPPMGWNSWNHFGNRVDDAIVRKAADALVNSGLAKLGYVYINIDDCWQGGRDAHGNIVPNKKFPDMKVLADYVHSKGLKLGLYSSPGPRTCGGYEGSFGHEEQDARTYAAWGIDYLKYDWCSAQRMYSNAQVRAVYQKMGEAISKAGRPIVYSLCEYGIEDVWKWGQTVGGNLWRTGYDINDSWNRMVEIGFNQGNFSVYAGPGHWNDPDMLEVGNGGMTDTEYRTHFSLWCLLAAPLLAGNDLNAMSTETLNILGNKEAIAVDQDALGKAAVPVIKDGDIQIWARDLHDGSKALGIFNIGEASRKGIVAFQDLKISGKQKVRDLWQHADLGVFDTQFNYEVPSHGVVFVKITKNHLAGKKSIHHKK
ncbi:MAG: glycoside hydrolase family 27 protein [Bacteroidota bacterium]|nr:glycoside hydrolase family 27 protein [Bacteroidota bacterium]MDP4268549.1 glycoside hydrolase family 27 protein [Bacteroidota bacterium]